MKFLYVLFLLSLNACASEKESVFKEFFNASQPHVVGSNVLSISPVNSEELVVDGDYASIAINFNKKNLSKVLILRGENKYSDEVCKNKNTDEVFTKLIFDPAANISQVTTNINVECSGQVIVWAQVENGELFKATKQIRVFQYHKGK